MTRAELTLLRGQAGTWARWQGEMMDATQSRLCINQIEGTSGRGA